MSIEELIKEASNKSPEFRQKWLYWCVQRQKQPSLEWLMANLEKALGKQYVKEQAQKYIESMQIPTQN